MSDFIKTAVHERARLSKAKVVFVNSIDEKIKLLDGIISSFDGKVDTITKKVRKVPRTGTKKEAIHDLAVACIKTNGGSAKLDVIHKYLSKNGMKVHIGMLKSYMYKYADIKSSRQKGFSVK